MMTTTDIDLVLNFLAWVGPDTKTPGEVVNQFHWGNRSYSRQQVGQFVGGLERLGYIQIHWDTGAIRSFELSQKGKQTAGLDDDRSDTITLLKREYHTLVQQREDLITKIEVIDHKMAGINSVLNILKGESA